MRNYKSSALLLFAAPLLLLPGTHGFGTTLAPFRKTVLRSTAVAEEPVVSPNAADVVAQDNQKKLTPAEREVEKFQCDDSVKFWREFDSKGSQGNFRLIQDLLARNTVNSSGGNTSLRAAYWSSQMLRTSYFTATAALGTLGSDLHERFIANRGAGDSSPGQSFLNLNGGSMAATILESEVPSRLIFEALKTYEQDWKFVESGLLNTPWDNVATTENNRFRLQLDHKQSNPLFALSETSRVIRESIGIFSRRNTYAGQPSDQVWIDQPAKTSVSYPDYYLNDFHYQTDGWLSSDSANTYEASTETLFLGRQDAMQRQTLIPLLKHFKTEPPKNILEVAGGTGRFATFVRDNFPQADMTISDLSPFYLEKARENDKYWRDYRGEKALQKRTPGIKNEKPKPAKFVQANAEELPFPDDTFDAVTCVYLFHEMPLEARENAAKEMARVLKPGGMVSFSDSIQFGDRPALDAVAGNFARLNEPHYEDYMQTYLAPLFEKHGLTCSEKYVSSSTKTLSFIKPESLVERAGNYVDSFDENRYA